MSSAAHRVTVLVYDGVKLLDVAGPAEVFGEANLLGADYRVHLVSPSGSDVTSSIGMRITVDGASAAAPDAGTFLLPGGDVHPRTPVTRDLIDAAQDLAGRAGRVASVCSGAFVLGAAGLLTANGRPPTGRSQPNWPPDAPGHASSPTPSTCATARRTPRRG